MSEALSQSCANAGHFDRWTCPGCYKDLDAKRPGRYTCADCGREVTCTLDHQPVCNSSLIEPGDEDG